MKKWWIVIILAVSQFIMILDSSVMNVSITTVATDLGTTISGMQTAITFYALTMAALMLTGGKLGDKWGKLRAFQIGSIVYGIGSLITALSPTLPVLLFGWSFIEGLGAILVIPAIAGIAAMTYSGRDRITAFSILGAVTGLAAAAGPIIGGFVTTYFSWRYVFAGETVIMLGVLITVSRMKDTSKIKNSKIDIASSVLSAIGMTLLVYGVLQTKVWGWIIPLATPEINGVPIAPFGISLCAYLILAGIFVLWLFVRRQRSLQAAGREPLLNMSLLDIPSLRSGLNSFMMQYFVVAALFFVIPVYLQVIHGFDALATGLKLIPLSVGLIIFSYLGSRASTSYSAKSIVRIGQILMAFGCLIVLGSISTDLHSLLFLIGLFVGGAGFGLLASQLGNVNMSAVPKEDTAEVGGLQGTYQNLGTSFGTAVVGSIFMLVLTHGFISSVQTSSDLSASAKTAIVNQASTGVGIVSYDQAYEYVYKASGSSDTAQEIASLYEQEQLKGLRLSVFIIFVIALFSTLITSRNLPTTVLSKK